jgi:membrane protein implicated in regulation of membrane protease activity
MQPKRRKTRVGRTFLWWGFALILVVACVGYPTQFSWPRWVYGLIWGGLTTGVIYLFRNFFEEEVTEPSIGKEDQRKKRS